jgi:hypothetical protein
MLSIFLISLNTLMRFLLTLSPILQLLYYYSSLSVIPPSLFGLICLLLITDKPAPGVLGNKVLT